MAPGTIYRRAIRRVERRAAAKAAADCEHTTRLLLEAVRTANRLAYCAGIAGPLAKEVNHVRSA